MLPRAMKCYSLLNYRNRSNKNKFYCGMGTSLTLHLIMKNFHYIEENKISVNYSSCPVPDTLKFFYQLPSFTTILLIKLCVSQSFYVKPNILIWFILLARYQRSKYRWWKNNKCFCNNIVHGSNWFFMGLYSHPSFPVNVLQVVRMLNYILSRVAPERTSTQNWIGTLFALLLFSTLPPTLF